MQTTMISWLIGQLICWFICCLIQLILLGHFSITLISNTPIPLTSCNVVYHSVLFKEISNHIPRVPPPPHPSGNSELGEVWILSGIVQLCLQILQT